MPQQVIRDHCLRGPRDLKNAISMAFDQVVYGAEGCEVSLNEEFWQDYERERLAIIGRMPCDISSDYDTILRVELVKALYTTLGWRAGYNRYNCILFYKP